MVKKKKTKKQKKEALPTPKIEYEDTEKFDALDRMMRENKGVRLE